MAAGAVAGVARLRRRLAGTAMLGLSCTLGLLAQAGARVRAPPELVDGAQWSVDAVVAAAPERGQGVVRVPVELRAVERSGARRAAEGRVRVVLGGSPVEPLLPEDRVRFSAVLRTPRGFLDPGAVDGERRAQAEGVIAVAGVHAPAALSKMAERVAWTPSRALQAWRARMLAEVAARLDGEPRALVESLVLGDRGNV